MRMKETALICPVTAEVHQFVRELPKADEEIEFEHMITSVSGSGFDIALQMQKTGFPYTLLAHCGTGAYGDMITKALSDNGIMLYNRSERENGCVYRMIAEDGKEAVLCMPGAEYEFAESSLDPLRDKNISCMIISGDIWFSESGDELAEALLDTGHPEIFYIHGTRYLHPDPLLKEVLFSLHPVMILKEYELAMFTAQGELSGAMKEIAQLTDNDVIILRSRDVLMMHNMEILMNKTDHEAVLHDFVSAYAACISSGCDVRNSLHASCAYASSEGGNKAETLLEDIRNILKNI